MLQNLHVVCMCCVIPVDLQNTLSRVKAHSRGRRTCKTNSRAVPQEDRGTARQRNGAKGFLVKTEKKSKLNAVVLLLLSTCSESFVV